MLNFNQLRAFYYTARHLSCTKAAEQLFITQPAITAQLKALEDSCEMKLFKRKGRRLVLTEEGAAIYEYAKKIFTMEKELEDLIQDMRRLKVGVLRLGTTKTYARYVMPTIIGRFHERFPHLKIQVDEGSSLEMIRSLLDLKNEVVVVAKVEDHPKVAFTPLSSEELVLIVSPEHKIAGEKTISVSELHEQPIIVKERGSGTRKLVYDLFAKQGLQPEVLIETSNTELIKQMVARGDGIAFLVRGAVAAEVEQGTLATVPLKEGPIYLDVSIAHLKDEHLSHAAKAFVDLVMTIPHLF
ncbi:MAG TPA: LysR family transcriptional regulator, partial [Armatimonadetes bacterium]|nr:LysR family transcriptional regulator [Armatimonadota bacterium]